MNNISFKLHPTIGGMIFRVIKGDGNVRLGGQVINVVERGVGNFDCLGLTFCQPKDEGAISFDVITGSPLATLSRMAYGTTR